MSSVQLASPNSKQIVLGRMSVDWSQKDLAHYANVGLATVQRLEALPPHEEPLDHLRPVVVRKIVSTLEAAGVSFEHIHEQDRLVVAFARIPKLLDFGK